MKREIMGGVSRVPKQKLDPSCEGCVKVWDNRCRAFSEPAFQWRNGKTCWGRSEDKDWGKKLKTALEKYKLVR